MNHRRLPLVAAILSLSATACSNAPQRIAETTQETPPKSALAPSYCLRETGTRVKVPGNACLPYPGRVVSRDDLSTTGSVDLGEALHRIGAY